MCLYLWRSDVHFGSITGPYWDDKGAESRIRIEEPERYRTPNVEAKEGRKQRGFAPCFAEVLRMVRGETRRLCGLQLGGWDLQALWFSTLSHRIQGSYRAPLYKEPRCLIVTVLKLLIVLSLNLTILSEVWWHEEACREQRRAGSSLQSCWHQYRISVDTIQVRTR